MAANTNESARIAVAGATGYIGARLVPRLVTAGYRVRCLVRSPRKLADRPWASDPRVEIVTVDLDDVAAVETALRDCAALFYLVHAMRSAGADLRRPRSHDGGHASRTRRAPPASGRIVYLGGLGSHDEGALSEHLASRREVEKVLAASGVPVTAFRAAMIIGSGSASFEILRYLTERLPVMVTPKWVGTPCQPIAVRNVLHYLVACLAVPETIGRTLEIGGPDVVSYADLIQLMAEARGLPRRRIVPVPLFTPRLSSLWIHLVTPVDAAIARPLAEGLRNPVVVTDTSAAALMPQPLLPVKEAIALALAAEARSDVESTWTAAGPIPGDPDWAGGKVFEDRRERFVAAPPMAVFAAVATLGGRRGWYRYNRLWLTRGILDRLVGGPGLAADAPAPDAAGLGRRRRLLAGRRHRAAERPDAARRDARARRRHPGVPRSSRPAARTARTAPPSSRRRASVRVACSACSTGTASRRSTRQCSPG